MAARKNGLRAEDILANTVMVRAVFGEARRVRTRVIGKSALCVRAAARWTLK